MKPLFALLVLATLAPAAEPLRWETHHLKKIVPGCGNRKDGCAYAEITYIKVISGPDAVRARINQVLSASDTTHLEWIRNFLSEYSEERKFWFESDICAVLSSSATVFSVECLSGSYTGGAHPNYATHYVNFDAATGGTLLLKDVLKNGSTPLLTKIAEACFRKVRELSPDEDLAEAGFHFDTFALNENYGFGPKALIFTWNPYEIAAHSFGIITIEIPYSEIRDLFKPGLFP